MSLRRILAPSARRITAALGKLIDAPHDHAPPTAFDDQDLRDRLVDAERSAQKLRTELNAQRDELRRFRSGWVPCFIPVSELQELPDCPVCDATHEHRYVYPYPASHERFRSLYVFGCGQCGVSWVPSGALDLGQYYASVYAEENRHDRDVPAERYFASVESTHYFQRARRQAEYVSLLGRPAERVLDLGSGPGYFLYALEKAQGRIGHKFACEPDRASHKYLEYLDAELVDWTEIERVQPLDVVLSSHSLEHYWLDELPGLLRSVRHALSDDGLFVFEVPSADLLRTPWHYRHDPHTVFFSRDSMDLLLRKAGFASVGLIPLYDKRFTPRPDAVFTPKLYPELADTGGIVGVASTRSNDPRVASFASFSPLRPAKTASPPTP